MNGISPRDWPRSVLTAAALISFALAVGILYWAQVVLIPIVLAALLTFLLSPLVTRLHRGGVPRIAAVVLVVVAAAAAVGATAYVVGRQVTELTNQLPQYRQNIKDKIADVRAQLRGGALEELKSTFEEVEKELETEQAKEGQDGDGRSTDGEPEEEEPVPVRIKAEPSTFALDFETLRPLLEVLATAGLVFVLVIFMLIKREDLRNRVVSLAGQSSLAVTTKALDEAGRRISRYLLMQFIINVTYGITAGVGLLLIGVPYPAVWGVCAAVLRYIPYVGPWVAALLPIGVSLITFPGWTTVLIVIGLFVVLELVSNNVMEPWLYGRSVGMSELAVIIAAVFWTWLWGPVGLIMSTPMTVCLVVLGKYIPQLAFLDHLLGERPAIDADGWLYQRLLARDEEEAAEIAEEHADGRSLQETFDELLLPVLHLVGRDRARGHLSAEDEEFVLRGVAEIVEDLSRTKQAAADESPRGDDQAPPPGAKVLVVGFPARDLADELAVRMLRETIDPRLCDFEILSSEMLIAERITAIEERAPACVCLVSVPPGDLVQTRQIYKRLRAHVPESRILVARLGRRGVSPKSREFLKSAGADRVFGSLAELNPTLVPLIQFYQHEEPARRDQRADMSDSKIPASKTG